MPQGRAAAASLKANTSQWDSLRLAVPTQSDIPALLRLLQKTAEAVHVNLQTISLTNSNSSASVTPTTTASTGANGIPVALTFAGGYVALDRLVKRLDGLVRIAGGKVHAAGPLLSISDVSLSGSPKLTVQITATIYQLAAATAAASTTGG